MSALIGRLPDTGVKDANIPDTWGLPGKTCFPYRSSELRTGVPAFLGFTESVPKDAQGHEQINIPHLLTLWAQFEENFGPPLAAGYLGSAVRGFFENGGSLCYVVRS